MKGHLIVDGYNIIYAWPEFNKNRETGLDYARSKLVSILADHAALTGLKVVVVFDAHQIKGGAERTEVVDGVEVIYTQQGETADSLIERMAGSFPEDGGTVYVATSDWAEQVIIFGRGAFRLTPGELREQVRRTKEESKVHYQQSKPVDGYLENRLLEKVRSKFEQWRRGKG
ncbi:YacP-like NYN domain protein [Pelotomaculum schinkii]|uniref:YacP-like NYN domain protein n=1 Tax=Pelotomaculum schinkii TaxID=78350 RepID=A0A4Y7RHS9_9FIRM|nr:MULTISPECIES: NYN domain-containing protein [Pelotomaculum]TEB08309.1 YacP-like NYN domain protein [Pelotomaculum schinkii]TEB13261.1 YacP-like NYN domain protein [Pelotomaculum sp. FP]